MIILFVISLSSCMKENECGYISERNNEPLVCINEYDIRAKDFAKALNAAIRENSDLRNIVKAEVLKQFDGDYNVLVKDIFNRKVSPSQPFLTKTGYTDEITVKELLSCYYNDTLYPTKSSNETLDELVSENPDLQIAVPVYAEEWDTETYIPDIAIVPSEFEDMVTETVPGIDSSGNEILIDAINEPENPTVVVGLNERAVSDTSLIVRPIISPIGGATVSLDAIYSDGAVRITANVVNFLCDVSSIILYRSNANSNTFSTIGNIPVSGLSYNDYEVEKDKEYIYYAVIISSMKTSEIGLKTYRNTSKQISIKTDGNIPNPVINLNSHNEYATTNFLTWDNPANESYKTNIYRTTPNESNVLIATLNPTDTYYYDDSVEPGEKWTYFVKKYNSNTKGESSYRKTYVYNPYRNPSAESKVMLKKIHVNCSEVESWIAGKPEFYITTYGHQKDGETGMLKVDTLSFIDIQFPSRGNNSGSINGLMADWSFFDDSQYYPVLNINMREYDRATASVSVKADVKCGYKKEDYIDLEALGSFEYEYKNESKDCGTVVLRYYEDPEQNLTFSNYDSYITISEIDDND